MSTAGHGPAVELVVGPRLRPLAGLTVNRVWPTARRRLIGPFIFLDHLQPVELPPGQGLDVPPHPHIGIATVTYLFEGELTHADSLGIRQSIRPGDLNWMTAGRGITHSERSSDDERSRQSRLHGVQAWVALPATTETGEPRFEHFDREALPRFVIGDVSYCLIAGGAFGHAAPVATDSPLFYLEAHVPVRATVELPAELGERGVYIVSGAIAVDDETYDACRLLVLASGRTCRFSPHEPSHLLLLGGPPLGGDRAIWWNFVATDTATIEAARADWAAGRFPPVPGDDERMPMPA